VSYLHAKQLLVGFVPSGQVEGGLDATWSSAYASDQVHTDSPGNMDLSLTLKGTNDSCIVATTIMQKTVVPKSWGGSPNNAPKYNLGELLGDEIDAIRAVCRNIVADVCSSTADDAGATASSVRSPFASYM